MKCLNILPACSNLFIQCLYNDYLVTEEFSTSEGVKYILLILAIAVVIVATSLMISSGKLGLGAGAGVILASYAAVYAVVRSFRRRFLSK